MHQYPETSDDDDNGRGPALRQLFWHRLVVRVDLRTYVNRGSGQFTIEWELRIEAMAFRE